MVLDGWVLKGHRTLEWLGWEGPKRSQNHGMVGSLMVTVPWNGWDGWVLKDHRTIERFGWEGP